LLTQPGAVVKAAGIEIETRPGPLGKVALQSVTVGIAATVCATVAPAGAVTMSACSRRRSLKMTRRMVRTGFLLT